MMSSVGVEGGGVEGRVGTKSRNEFHNTVPTQQTRKKTKNLWEMQSKLCEIKCV